jgi:hypothetical protein
VCSGTFWCQQNPQTVCCLLLLPTGTPAFRLGVQYADTTELNGLGKKTELNETKQHAKHDNSFPFSYHQFIISKGGGGGENESEPVTPHLGRLDHSVTLTRSEVEGPKGQNPTKTTRTGRKNRGFCQHTPGERPFIPKTPARRRRRLRSRDALEKRVSSP